MCVTSACAVLCTLILILLAHICCALCWIQHSFSQLGRRGIWKTIAFKDILSKINGEHSNPAMWLFHVTGFCGMYHHGHQSWGLLSGIKVRDYGLFQGQSLHLPVPCHADSDISRTAGSLMPSMWRRFGSAVTNLAVSAHTGRVCTDFWPELGSTLKKSCERMAQNCHL